MNNQMGNYSESRLFLITLVAFIVGIFLFEIIVLLLQLNVLVGILISGIVLFWILIELELDKLKHKTKENE